MNNQAYSGAFSRRRFQNPVTKAADTVDTPDVNAENSKLTTLTVSWDGAMGRVTGNGTYHTNTDDTPANSGKAVTKVGDSITLTATPKQGFHFVKWLGRPVDGYVSNPVTIKMTNNFSVSAVFEADKKTEVSDFGTPTYTLTATGNSLVDKAVPFVKKWWWAILIVAYIAYKNWKGAKQ